MDSFGPHDHLYVPTPLLNSRSSTLLDPYVLSVNRDIASQAFVCLHPAPTVAGTIPSLFRTNALQQSLRIGGVVFIPMCVAVQYLDIRYLFELHMCALLQGGLYFHNSVLKIVTDQDMRQPRLLQLMEETAKLYSPSELPEHMEMHISSFPKERTQGVTNAAINHKYCVASSQFDEVGDSKVPFLDPIRLNSCRRLYWTFLNNHPVHVPTPTRALQDASDALTWFYTDNLVSGARSTVPFSKSECEELSRIVEQLALPRNDNSVAKTVFLAWLLREVCSYRDAYRWGQHTQKELQFIKQERRNSGTSSYDPPMLIAVVTNFVINVLFFGIPHTYRGHIKAASEYRGRLPNVQKIWESYIQRLVKEYSDFLLISTVLLSATVGFLAVPNIPEGAQVAAALSTFASLSSIIIGVFSIWRHQSNTSTKDSFTYMHNVQHGYLGLSGHAILLSLPPTLLVWAILLFTLSVIAYVAQGLRTNTSIWGRLSTYTVLVIFATLAIIVGLALYTFSIIWTFQHRSRNKMRRLTQIFKLKF